MLDLSKTIDLSTTYLGLELRNPLVASSSPMCEDVGNIRRMDRRGVAGADVADAFEEFVEVIGDAGAGRVLEALVVHGEAFDEVFAETCGGPLAELRAARCSYAVADGEDGGEAVVLNLAGDLACAFGRTIRNFRMVDWRPVRPPRKY